MKEIINLEHLTTPKYLNCRSILILTDFVNATYYQTFYYPINALPNEFSISLVTLTQQDITEQLGEQDPDSFFQKILEKEEPDLVIFNRYALPYGSIFLDLCRVHKVPNVYFIDDDLINIPENWEETLQKRQGDPEVIKNRKYLLENTDFIYASTEYLSKRLAEKLPSQQIFFGVYPTYLESLIKKNLSSKKEQKDQIIRLGYMASRGHQKDLEIITPAINKILTNYPQVRFETFGTISLPTELTDKFGERVCHQPVVKYDMFLQNLYELDWDLGLAPLIDTEFNRCKSPVKYLEYTACNVPVIASNSLVYNKIINGENGILAEQDNWYDSIDLLINNPQLRYDLLTKAKETCLNRFSLGYSREQILKVVNLLVQPPEKPQDISHTKLVSQVDNYQDLEAVVNLLKSEKIDLRIKQDSLQAQSKQISSKNSNLKSKIKQVSSENSNLKSKIKQVSSENSNLKSINVELQGDIEAMKSSKFWKLRDKWFELKATFANIFSR